MQVILADGWQWFCITLGILLIATFLKGRLSRQFYTQDVVLRRFNIIDFEWPGSPLELENLIKGLYRLPEKRAKTVTRAVKNHLYIDFLFIPAAYGSIFLLCMKVAGKMDYFGPQVFAVLAWAQLIPLLIDVYENFYLLKKISPDFTKTSLATFKNMQRLEIVKWVVSLLSVILGLSAILYFWLNGNYKESSLGFLAIIAVEVVLFFVAGKVAARFLQKVT